MLSDEQELVPRYPSGKWVVERNANSSVWTASQDRAEGGITTEADSWAELLPMMIEAQRLWDEPDPEVTPN